MGCIWCLRRPPRFRSACLNPQWRRRRQATRGRRRAGRRPVGRGRGDAPRHRGLTVTPLRLLDRVIAGRAGSAASACAGAPARQRRPLGPRGLQAACWRLHGPVITQSASCRPSRDPHSGDPSPTRCPRLEQRIAAQKQPIKRAEPTIRRPIPAAAGARCVPPRAHKPEKRCLGRQRAAQRARGVTLNRRSAQSINSVT